LVPSQLLENHRQPLAQHIVTHGPCFLVAHKNRAGPRRSGSVEVRAMSGLLAVDRNVAAAKLEWSGARPELPPDFTLVGQYSNSVLIGLAWALQVTVV